MAIIRKKKKKKKKKKKDKNKELRTERPLMLLTMIFQIPFVHPIFQGIYNKSPLLIIIIIVVVVISEGVDERTEGFLA